MEIRPGALPERDWQTDARMRAPTVAAPRPLALPNEPFRGIEYFRYVDAPIFFARDEESTKLVRLVTIYRGTLLYGDSGAGKSSLINARFLPDIIAEGFVPDRLRVQPRAGEEFIVERISLTSGNQPPFLTSCLAPEESPEPRIVLSVAAFKEAVNRAAAAEGSAYPLLIFDQFEELVTQFEEAPSGRDTLAAARAVQAQIVDTILQLLRDQTLRVKLLFVFREDYLAKVHRLFARYPDLADRYLRLTSPKLEALERIIRGPFEEHPGHFGNEISPELAARLGAAITERAESGVLNLSEVQIACLRLWRSSEPDKLLADRGVAGLLEDYSLDALGRLSEQHRDAAIAVLAALVTTSGTRNIVSEDDLVGRLQSEEGFGKETVQKALVALVNEARLIRRELRHDTSFYEIVSEFLIPLILRKKGERQVERERIESANRMERKLKEEREAAEAAANKEKRRQLVIGISMLSVLVVLLLVALAFAWYQRNAALTAAVEVSMALIGKDEAEAKTRAALIKAQEEREAAQKARITAEAALNDLQKQVTEATANLTAQLGTAPPGPNQKEENAELLRRAAPLARTLTDLSNSSTKLARNLYGSDAFVLLSGHTDSIWTAAISNSGQLIATASADKTVRVWKPTGEVKAILLASTSVGGATCAAFSPDGRYVVTGSAGEAVRVFDIEDQEQVKVWASHTDTVTAVAYSPDGKQILSASADKSVKLWAAADRTTGIRDTLANWVHPRTVTAAAFSADGHWVVSSCDDGVLRVWDAASPGNTRPAREQKLDAPPRRAVFSPVSGSTRIAAACGNNLVLWDAEGLAPVRVRTGHTAGVIRLAFSPDGKWVATAGADGVAFLWNAEDESAPIPIPVQVRGRLLCIAWAGNIIATGGENGSAELWDVTTRATPQRLAHWRAHEGPVWFAAFTPDGKHFVTTSATTEKNEDLPTAKGKAAESIKGVPVTSDHTARIWDVASVIKQESGRDHKGPPSASK